MGKTSSAVKRRYNKGAYRRYEVSVGIGTKLNAYLEEYKGKGGNVSALIKKTLADYFRITSDELWMSHVDQDGVSVQKYFLDEFEIL